MAKICFMKSLVAAAAMTAVAGGASADSTLRVVMHSDLKIVDPIWTTAYMSRNYGYMVYDTLFAMDEDTKIHPQMVEKYSVGGPNNLTYTFTLRDGLMFHDGAPVTSADVIQSIKRWGGKDSMGQMLMKFTKEMKAVDDKTFQLILNEPFGLVLVALGKPSSNVPFIMPKRVADTPKDTQISEYVGSGPFVFDAANWKPGDKAVFRKNSAYRPRAGKPSWGAGGKVVNVDTVEWISIKDHNTAVNALISGEVDYIESPPVDLLPLLEAADDVKVEVFNKLCNQLMFRLNHLHPPFNNVKARRAALAAIDQIGFLKAVIGDPRYYKECPAMFMCGSSLATDKGADIIMKSDYALSKKLLKEAGYDGTPIVVMQSTDVDVLNNLGPTAAQHLRRGGFKVDLQAMDWQTLVARRAKKDKPADGGWNVFMTSWTGTDILNPILAAGFNAGGAEKGWFGWPDDAKMEALRDQFAKETDPAKQKAIAEAIQVRAMEVVTHGHGGQWTKPAAWSTDLSNVIGGPFPIFWNLTKK